MGSKGSSQRPAPPSVQPAQNTVSDIMPFMEMMMSMSQQSMAAMSAASAPPELPSAPTPSRSQVKPVDWSGVMEDLSNKMSADYEDTLARNHGREDTVHTSPLLDEKDADVTTSILG